MWLLALFDDLTNLRVTTRTFPRDVRAERSRIQKLYDRSSNEISDVITTQPSRVDYGFT